MILKLNFQNKPRFFDILFILDNNLTVKQKIINQD